MSLTTILEQSLCSLTISYPLEAMKRQAAAISISFSLPLSLIIKCFYSLSLFPLVSSSLETISMKLLSPALKITNDILHTAKSHNQFSILILLKYEASFSTVEYSLLEALTSDVSFFWFSSYIAPMPLWLPLAGSSSFQRE